MATCQYFHDDKLIAEGIPALKDYLFNGGLEDLLPGLKGVPKLLRGGESNDIRYSIRSANIELPDETTPQKIQRLFQNGLNRIGVLQNTIKSEGGTVNKTADVLAAMEAHPNQSGAKIQTFHDTTVLPLMDKLGKITQVNGKRALLQDVAMLIYAKHAPEANAQVSKINPKYKGDAGSGMTNAESIGELNRLRLAYGTNYASMETLANEWQAITNNSLEMLHKSGAISDEQYQSYKGAYSYYAPLKGFEEVDKQGNITQMGTGKGMSASKFSKRRLGRSSRAGQIIENIVRDHSRAIIASNKAANVHPKLWQLLQDNPELVGEDKQFEVEYSPTQPALVNGTVRNVPKQFDIETEIKMFRDGKEVRIKPKDDLITRAFNDLSNENLTGIYSAASMLNRFLRQAWTQKNPAFFIINPIRDIQQAMVVLAGDKGLKFAAQTLSPNNWGSAWKTVLDHSTGKNKNDPMMQRYLKAGGSIATAYIASLDKINEDLHVILERNGGESLLDLIRSGEYQRAGKIAAVRSWNNVMFRGIEHLNTAFENATRLSTFKTAIDNGLSDDEAAKMSRDVTVNFSRHGELGKKIGAMYLFANANIQGTQNLWRTLTSGDHKGQAWGMVSALATLGFMAAMMGGDDGDDDLQPDYEKNRNLTFEYAEGKRFAIPLPYGWSWFRDLGRASAQVINGGDAEKISGKLASSFFGNFSPIGDIIPDGKADSKNFVVAIAPTFAKPVIMPAVNRSAFGSDLMPENTFKQNEPDSEKAYRKTRGTAYDDLAKSLNSLTGGDEATEGWVSVSPETLKNTLNYLTGGAGRFVADTVSSGSLATNPNEELTLEKTPIAKSFFKSESIDDYRRRFNEQFSEVASVKERYSTYRKSKDFDKVVELKKEQGRLLALAKQAENTKNILKRLRDKEDEARNNGNYETADALESRQRELLMRFNTRFVV